MAPKYTLTYFPIPGRAEVARLMFKVANVEFADQAITFEDWPKHKGDSKRFPVSQMPTLEFDGKVICQSFAIYRYLANEFGQYGSNNSEKVDIDQICETLAELMPRFLAIAFDGKLSTDEKNDKSIALFNEEGSKQKINFVLSFLKHNNDGKGFFVGNKISLADFFVYAGDALFSNICPSFHDPYPELQAFVSRINSIDAVKKHNEEKK